MEHDIVIVGGGPAGMAAAVAAFDAGVRDVVILDREPVLGGILQQCIHSGFGLHKLGKELTGPEYAHIYIQEVIRRGIRVYPETTVTALSPEKLVTARNREGLLQIQAKAVVLAMGCRERARGALNIAGTRPAGVYSAGTAQKLINCMGCQIGKKAVILGSGDIGLIMARRMRLEGVRVEAVCEIMPHPGGLQRNIVQCLEDFEIPLYLGTTVVQTHGDQRLEGVTVAQVDENRRPIMETKRYIPCDILLLSVGLIPDNELTRAAGIPTDPVTGGALVDEDCQTGIPGIFACGNVVQVHDLVDNVSEEAERAGLGAASAVQGTVCTPESDKIRRYPLPRHIAGADKKQNLICTLCPQGCAMAVEVQGTTVTVTGNTCPKGEEYAIQEYLHPMRTVTATVEVGNREDTLVSVKTELPVPRERMMDVMEKLRSLTVTAPIAMGEEILGDVFGTRIIATREIP